MRTTAILVGVVAASLALAGCSAGQQSTAPAAPAGSEALDSSSPLPTADPSLAAAPAALPDAIALPDGVDPASDAALAWEALMSADGEYAAAASYLAVLDAFGTVEPYATILEGELRHIDALTRQLERYGISVPVNPYLGLIDAPDDLQTAATAWAQGEVRNVELYDQLIAQADSSTLVRVLENLRRASLESHLPLFQAAAEAGGTLDAVTR